LEHGDGSHAPRSKGDGGICFLEFTIMGRMKET